MTHIDRTHDKAATSWVASANGHPEFPIQNLPFGAFSPSGGAEPRGGVAIGDSILDLRSVQRAGLIVGDAADALAVAARAPLNDFLALGSGPRRALRLALFDLLKSGGPALECMLYSAAGCELHLPVRIGDYTDFFAGIHHALNVGRLFRPDNPLMPNYKYIPIGYHGRASSIRPSGEPVRRPNGQRKRRDEAAPTFGAVRNLDLELELGVWVGPGNVQGEPVQIDEAASHIAGFCLLNDWSARDIQAWEYQPLGPFLAKSFASTISPWIITPEAIAPFRAPQPARPEGDPKPLEYLNDAADQAEGALDLDLKVLILTPRMKAEGEAPFALSKSSALNMYWTVAQFIAHHTSGGCNLNPGDLLGSGTISAPDKTGYGSLLEITRGGAEPISLPNGETRGFLHDGDEIILQAYGRRNGYAPIGFGQCRAKILPAL